MPRDVPESLQRRGITKATDNLAPGEEVTGFERAFAEIFRDELAEKFHGVPMPAPAAEVGSPEYVKAAARARAKRARTRIKQAKVDRAAAKADLNRMAARTETEAAAPAPDPAGQTS